MSESEDLGARKAQLSEAKRALLLRRLQGQRLAEKSPAVISARSLTGHLPLSYTQQRVWFLQRLYPQNVAYNMHEAWRARGALDIPALKEALNAIVARHAALRTRFVTVEDDEPRQVILPVVRVDIPVHDLRALPADARDVELHSLAVAEGNRPFDLTQAPLVRLGVVRLGENEHALLLTFHHIITDEWSNDVFWRDLNTAYSRAAGYGADPLPELPLQYPDYAAWQREQVAAGELDGQLAYWRAQLSGELPLVQLPQDRLRPSTQSLRGGLVRQIAPDGLLEELQKLSQRSGGTLYMTLLAAFQLLLQRYSAQTDILTGTPIANRQRAETVDIMGMFINTAVIRSDFSGNPNFAQLLAQVREKTLGALAQQDLPFDVLVQDLQPERDLSYNPLFQTMFVYSADNATRALPGLDLTRMPLDRGVAKFDLTLLAGEEDGRLVSTLEYNSDLFDRATAARLLDHWQNLLHSVVTHPEAPVSALSLIGAAERETVLVKWNDTALPLGEPVPLHKLISAQATREPGRTAVVGGGERLSYAALEAEANRLAHCLMEHGLAPGTPVGLYVPRSSAMLIGILGILKAGGAYVPLEPAYPAERIAFALQDTRAPLVVTIASLVAQLPASGATTVVLDEVLAADAGWPTMDPDTAISLDDIAYIIYTSGTTGTPKGVMVTHNNLRVSTLARRVTYAGPVESYLLLSSFAFDSSVAGIFWTLATGGALILPGPDEEQDVLRLAAIIAEQSVTHTLALPSLYRLLLDYAPPGALASLRIVIMAGEACPPDLGALHGRAVPQARLYNEYGPTEATVWCSVYQVPPEAPAGPVPIGRPIANYQLYILDARQNPLPIGVPGELYVGGAAVTPGYWGNPALTAERFPVLQIDGYPQIGRVYRTGDLARWRADGEIDFLGRVDNQVKIRGYRIELGEIESLLQGHSVVREAAVVVWEQAGTAGPGKSLVAYVTGTEAHDVRWLRNELARRLPEYMVPREIVHLPALPRTPNGKLDHRALPQPTLQSDSDRPFVPPRTPAEQTLSAIWRDILRLPQVSTDAKFFELGGDSLMSIQVIARARQEGLLLTPRQLFQEQTIARLAAVALPATPPAAGAVELVGPVPLAPIQQWFFAQEMVDPAQWNQAAWFEITESLNREYLDLALAELVLRHPQLRARFTPTADAWQQEVRKDVPVTATAAVDLSHLEPQAQEAALLEEAGRLHATLNLQNGPLLRSCLFDLGVGRLPRLLLIVHHLVVDTISWGILSADLAAVYEQLAAGDAPERPVPSATYTQWTQTGIALAQSGKLRLEAAYWRRPVTAALPLPRDFKSTERNTEGSSTVISVSLPSKETGQLLRDVHEAYHTRMEDVLLTALARAIGAWTGSSTTLLTVERHGREELDPRLDLSQIVGWFTALFPLALRPGDRGDPGGNLRAVKEQLRAVPQNGVSYGLLRYHGDVTLRDELAAQPRPEVLFNYLGQARQAYAGGALFRPLFVGIGQAYGPGNSRAHVLDVNARVENGQLVVRWQYPRSAYRPETIQRLAQAYLDELRILIAHCLQVENVRYTPSDFPLAGLQQDDLDSLSDLLSQLE